MACTKKIHNALWLGVVFSALATTHGFSTDATWTTTTSSDLNLGANWTGGVVPDGIATFDSTVPSVVLTPTATTNFTIGTFDFPNSSSAFSFTLDACRLTFNGGGITTANADTTITVNNINAIPNIQRQVFFSSAASSLQSSTLNVVNSGSTAVSGSTGTASRQVQIDPPFSMASGGAITITNEGVADDIGAGVEAGIVIDEQLLFASSFTAVDGVVITISNSGEYGVNESGRSNNVGFVNYQFRSLGAVSVGNSFNLSTTNEGSDSSAPGSNQNSAGSVGQNQVRFGSSFTALDGASITLSNMGTMTSLGAFSLGAGFVRDSQLLANSSFTAGNTLTITATNEGNNTASNFNMQAGFVSASQVRINTTFTALDSATIEISNIGTSTNSGTSGGSATVNGGDQFFVGSTFQVGDLFDCSITNSGTDNSTGASTNNTGYINGNQFRVAGSATVGDTATIEISNSGTSTNSSALGSIGVVVGSQFLCSGTFTAGTDLSLTITNTASNAGSSTTVGSCSSQALFTGLCTIDDGSAITVSNTGSGRVLGSQLWFQNGFALTSGTATFQVTNAGSVVGRGIYVQGNSPGADVNIILTGASLYVDTTAVGFTIGALNGDSSSTAQVDVPLTINTDALVSATFAGVISNFPSVASSLIKAGSGTQTLSGVNSYSGGTTLSSGTIVAGSSSALGSGTVTMANATTLNLNSGVSLSNAFSLTGTGNFFVDSGNTATLSGNFAATVGILNKTGSGTLVLSGTNSYSGGTTLSSGAITAGSNTALGSGTTTMANATTLNLNNSVSLSNAFSLTGTGTFFVDSGNTATLSGNFAVTAGVLNKTGSGTLVLSGNNSYSGGTALTSGSITAGSSTALGSGTATMANSTTLNLNNGVSLSNAFSLTGTGNFFVDSGNTAAISGNFAATAGILNKTGSGTLVLSGVNSYSGGTSLSSGAITAGSSTALGSNTVTMANATTLNINNGVNLPNAFSLTGTGNFFVDSGNTATISGNFAATSAVLNKTGIGTLILSGTNSYSGGTNLTAGSISVASGNSLGSGTLNFTGGNLIVTASTPISNAMSVTSNGMITSSADTVFLGVLTGSDGITLTLSGSGNSLSTVAVSSGTFTIAGPIGGIQALTKTGSGTLVLTGTNSYSGGTSLTNGAITAGSNDALGSGTATMANATTLNINNGVNLPNAFSLSGTGNFFVDSGNIGTISGNFAATAGILNKTGSGTLILSGTNSYSGGTNLTAGSISVASGDSLGSGALNFTGGNLIVTASTTIPNAMSVTSNGMITSAADTVFSNALTGSDGITLTLSGNGNSLSTVAVNSGTFTIAGPIGGTQDLTKTGSGILVLPDTSTYTGATNLNAGTLLVTGDISSTSLLTVASGATLTGNGTVGPTVVNGTIKGGNPLGTLRVDGTLSLESGSIFTTTIVPGDPSLIVATGAVTIDSGTTWNLFVTPGHYTFVNTFVVLEGASVTGQFSNLTVLGQPLNTGVIQLGYFPTQVVAFIVPSALNVLAVGENEVHTIETVAAADVALSEIFGSLLPLSFSEEDFNDALSRLHPAQLKGMAIAQENNAVQVRQAVSERMASEIDSQICFPSFGAHKENRTCCEKHKRIMTAWVSPMGSTLTQDKVVNHFGPLTGYRVNTTGVVGGVDAFFGDHFYAGTIGAYTDSHLDFNSNKGSGNVYSSYAGLYAAAITEMFYANLSVVGSLNTYQTKRHIEYGSDFTAVNLDARESHKGKQILSHFDTGINFNFGGYTLRPFDSFDYMSQNENGYKESDAGEWDLSVGEKNAVMLRNELGLEFVARLCTRHSKWTFSPKIAWVREVRTKGGGYDVQFIAGGSDFKIHGYFPDRSLVAPGMSIAGMFLDDSLTLNLYYNGEFKGNYSANNYGGRVSYSF